MSRGKYSPALTREMIKARNDNTFIYNADREIPPSDCNDGEYTTRTHFPNYDKEGYDSYGYSAFDHEGNYIGIGDGIDRWGYTELEYLGMSDDTFNDIISIHHHRNRA